MFPNITNSFPINKPQTFMKGLDLLSHSGFFFPLKMNHKMKRAILPVLDQGYDLRVCLPNDALSIHLHYPIPWAEKKKNK